MPRLAGNSGSVLIKNTKTLGDKLLEQSREIIQQGSGSDHSVEGDGVKPHFHVGSKELYFPKARIILLRPNAKHTPYQSKFIVPKSFNKLDLRDYLFNVYGLRAMNITTQLLHSKYFRLSPHSSRFRGPQIKKMTIEMMEPFVWPDEPAGEENDNWNLDLVKEMQKYRTEQELKIGSDNRKLNQTFDGIAQDYEDSKNVIYAQPFISKLTKNQMLNKREKYNKEIEIIDQINKINKYVVMDKDESRVEKQESI